MNRKWCFEKAFLNVKNDRKFFQRHTSFQALFCKQLSSFNIDANYACFVLLQEPKRTGALWNCLKKSNRFSNIHRKNTFLYVSPSTFEMAFFGLQLYFSHDNQRHTSKLVNFRSGLAVTKEWKYFRLLSKHCKWFFSSIIGFVGRVVYISVAAGLFSFKNLKVMFILIMMAYKVPPKVQWHSENDYKRRSSAVCRFILLVDTSQVYIVSQRTF